MAHPGALAFAYNRPIAPIDAFERPVQKGLGPRLRGEHGSGKTPKALSPLEGERVGSGGIHPLPLRSVIASAAKQPRGLTRT